MTVLRSALWPRGSGITPHWNGPAGRNGPCDLETWSAPGRPSMSKPLSRASGSIWRGLNPTVYSASLHRPAGRRHFSLCEADLTRSSDVARADVQRRTHQGRGHEVQPLFNPARTRHSTSHLKIAAQRRRSILCSWRCRPHRCGAWPPSLGSSGASLPPGRSSCARSCRP